MVQVNNKEQKDFSKISFWIYPVTKSSFIAELAKWELAHGEINFLFLLSFYVVACNWCRTCWVAK